MATAITVYNSAVESALSGLLDLQSGDVGVALYVTKTAIDHDHQFLSEILDTEADAGSPPVTNYSRETQTLDYTNITRSTNITTFDLTNSVWSSLGNAGEDNLLLAILYKDTAGADSVKELIAYIDLDDGDVGIDITGGNDFAIQWNASGVFTATSD